jgi:tRNA nucleotidyltransferase (CCA-adding enzyme)
MEVITTHVNADFDCLGSMVAAQKLYPDAIMVFSGSQEKTMRDFFLKSTGFEFNFKKLKEIDLESITRLILVDCQHASRIGPFSSIIGKPGLEVHLYDHHPHTEGEIRATGGEIRAAGSTTTILTLRLMASGIQVTPAEATLMMLGVYEDTGKLTFSSTTDDDFKAAGWLFGQGANLNTVSDFVSQELTAEQVSLLNDLLHSLVVINCHGIDVHIAHASLEYYLNDVSALAHRIRDMEELDVLFLVIGMESRVYIVARSRTPDVNVGEFMQEFGGGGHATAASATVKDQTVIQVLDRLKHLLRTRINPQRTASDIMTAPVKYVTDDISISEARELLTRYSFNTMPVLKGKAMIGFISRQVVEKAIFHQLGESPVTDYMQTEFISASVDTPLGTVKDALISGHQSFIPIFSGSRLAGIITRTDLLRYMHKGEPPQKKADMQLTPMTSDLEGKMKRMLPASVMKTLRDAGAIASRLDVKVYAVGGFVRDLIIGQENLDIDLTVEGDGILFAEEFCREHRCRMKSHHKFGTAVIMMNDGRKIDVASTRLEYYESPGVLPIVERSSLRMDLYRRDFTINTLAVCLNSDQFGRLTDYFGALRDLKDKSLKVLHNLSFVEDPTRVFRAVRFEQRLGFHISLQTENLIKNAVKMNFLDKLGGKRLLTELIHILNEKEPLKAVIRMESLGLLSFLHRKIRLNTITLPLLEESEQIISWFELLYLGINFEKWIVYFLALTSELGPREFIDCCIRLAVNKTQRDRIAENRQKGLELLKEWEKGARRGRELLPSSIYRPLKVLPVEILLHLMAVTTRDDVRKRISHFFTHLSSVKILITGNDLKKFGIPNGPLYREILDRVMDARLDGEVESRDDELRLVEKLLS